MQRFSPERSSNHYRVRALQKRLPDEEYITVECTVVSLFDVSSEHIKQAGLLRDPSGVIKFVSWASSDTSRVAEGETYLFENVSVNESDHDEYNAEIAFRSRTTVTYQYTGTREEMLSGLTPEDQSGVLRSPPQPTVSDLINSDQFTVTAEGVENVEDSHFPWDTSFIEYLKREWFDEHTTVGGSTEVTGFGSNSVSLKRTYVLRTAVREGGKDLYSRFSDFYDSEYISRVNVPNGTVTLPRLGICEECSSLHDMTTLLGYDPCENGPPYTNWWYGGNGTETNEEFELVSCPDCGAEPEWVEQYDYGKGVLSPPRLPAKVSGEWTVEFEQPFSSVSGIESALEQRLDISDVTIKFTTHEALRRRGEQLSERLQPRSWEVVSSGDTGRRGVTRKYIQMSFEGILTKEQLEAVNSVFSEHGEALCRVKDVENTGPSQTGARTIVNGYYYSI